MTDDIIKRAREMVRKNAGQTISIDLYALPEWQREYVQASMLLFPVLLDVLAELEWTSGCHLCGATPIEPHWPKCKAAIALARLKEELE